MLVVLFFCLFSFIWGGGGRGDILLWWVCLLLFSFGGFLFVWCVCVLLFLRVPVTQDLSLQSPYDFCVYLFLFCFVFCLFCWFGFLGFFVVVVVVGCFGCCCWGSGGLVGLGFFGRGRVGWDILP